MISEEIISFQLNHIKTVIINKIIGSMEELPIAIYLVGSYGRGEGAWYEDELGLHPYNDFDLAVITDNGLPYHKNEALRKELAREIGISWVDIDYYSLSKIKSLRPIIHDVDLVEGSSLIYGEDVLRDYGIHLDKREIGEEDLVKLYTTRMWTFLGSWRGPFRDLTTTEARFFKNQMAKAILAACDMRLVKLRKYTSSYKERVGIILSEYDTSFDFCELVRWAINEKLRPSDSSLSKNEMMRLYFGVKKQFVESYEYALGNKALYYLDPFKTKSFTYCHSRILLLHIYSLIRYHRSRVLKGNDIFCAQNFVFLANNEGVIQQDMLENAFKLLYKYGYCAKDSYTWDELRDLVSNARNNL